MRKVARTLIFKLLGKAGSGQAEDARMWNQRIGMKMCAVLFMIGDIQANLIADCGHCWCCLLVEYYTHFIS